ncbi:MAG: metalloregulator ArsR/SmtB family transcription factor [Clostridia bacterium]
MKVEKIPRCDCTVVHADTVQCVLDHMPPDDTLYDISELFCAFSDSTRVRILWALSCAELCVCDLASALSMTSTAISHQLRLLKQARLVKFRREGKSVYYSLSDDHVKTMFAQAIDHISEDR